MQSNFYVGISFRPMAHHVLFKTYSKWKHVSPLLVNLALFIAFHPDLNVAQSFNADNLLTIP